MTFKRNDFFHLDIWYGGLSSSCLGHVRRSWSKITGEKNTDGKKFRWCDGRRWPRLCY